MTKNIYYLPIGDWSNDGHGKCKNIAIEVSGTIEQLREAHFQIKPVLGIDIHKIAGYYEVDWIEKEDLAKLMDIGLNPEDYTDVKVYKDELTKILNDEEIEYEYEHYHTTTSEYIGQLWIDLLNKVDSNLQIKIIEKPIQSIAFFGFDEKGRHIDFVGYGIES